MYTADDYNAYCQAEREMSAHQGKFMKRACEVYIRLYEECLKECSLGNDTWTNARLYEACREEIGLSKKCGRFTEVVATVDGTGCVSLKSTFSMPGDTDNLWYDFDPNFLWDESAIAEWIERSKKEYHDNVSKRREEEAAAEEARERADFERLKLKFGNT